MDINRNMNMFVFCMSYTLYNLGKIIFTIVKLPAALNVAHYYQKISKQYSGGAKAYPPRQKTGTSHPVGIES